MPRFATLISSSAVPAALALLLAGCGGPAKPGEVSGHYIVALSDADMTAPALITGRLDPRDDGTEDTLTVITLPIQEPRTPFAQIPVSNSVIGPPNALAVTRDGKSAFVIETRGPAPQGATSVKELPRGRWLFAIDMTDPLKPVIRDQVAVGNEEADSEPLSVDVHPDGNLVAIARRSPGEQIVIVGYNPTSAGGDGHFDGAALAFDLTGTDDSGATPSAVVWRPGGHHLAVTLPDRDQVIFYEFIHKGDQIGLQSWGEPVNVGKYPVSGAFSPDGRFFITTESQWGKDVEDFSVGAPEGRVSVIRLSPEPTEQYDDQGHLLRPVVHEVVASAVVGVSPQGIAISPDGSLVVTANLRRSFLPEDDTRLTRGGSLSLLSLDPATGKIRTTGEFQMDAMPVGISFDSAGNYLVATLFRSFDPRSMPQFGELGFWRVIGGAKPALEKTEIYVGVGKGPHGVVIVR